MRLWISLRRCEQLRIGNTRILCISGIFFVIPAQAGIQIQSMRVWIPFSAPAKR